MKLGQLREDRDSLTKTLSEIVRQLDFAGIAIIWIFRTKPGTGGFLYDDFLLWPLGLFALSLAFDLLQYSWSSAVFDNRYRRLAQGEVDDDTVVPDHNPHWNWPTRTFFYGKTALAVSPTDA